MHVSSWRRYKSVISESPFFYTKNFELFYGGAKKIRNFADRINHIRATDEPPFTRINRRTQQG